MFDVYPDQYTQLLEDKVVQLNNLFSGLETPEMDVLSSPSTHFRMRAEFRIWHTDDKIDYIMFSKEDKRLPVVVTNFPRAHKSISDLMQPLLKALKSEEVLKTRLFEIDFLCSLAGEMLVTLIYHKKLDDEWVAAATKIQSQFMIKLIGRSRKQKEILSDDFIIEDLTVNNKSYRYQQVENAFTQPNAEICQKMLSWAVNNTRDYQGDLIELYCGNGNFTLPLSQNFNRVLATEVSKTSVKSARFNIDLNKIENITVLRMSSEDFTQALNKEREFRRLADIDLESYNLTTIFLDPPRAGLDDETLKLASQFENIIYISCNPLTLIENLKQLANYKIKKIALFDQFPYTDHIECGVILERLK